MIDLKKIEELAIEQFILPETSIHGIDHWKRVEENGLLLANQPLVDPLVVNLFALLHDCKREDDYEDPEHGERAAKFVLSIRSSHLNFLDEAQIEKLWNACMYHNKGFTHEDPTIGACFDADRLELTRCGILPLENLMSTPLGKRMAVKMSEAKECHR